MPVHLVDHPLVHDALNSHGVASTGPVSERNWALTAGAPRLKFRRELAQTLSTRKLKFTCLVPPDTIYERVALHVKRQLAQVSVDMDVQEASQEQIVQAVRSGNFDAVLGDILSGPSMFRLYQRWHTSGAYNARKSSPLIDVALDRVRHPREVVARQGGKRGQPRLRSVAGERALILTLMPVNVVHGAAVLCARIESRII